MENRKLTTLKEIPSAKWHCGSKPVNPQGVGWTDTFKIETQANILVVTRTDRDEGWGQSLQVKCCTEVEGTNLNKVSISAPSVTLVTPHSNQFAMYRGKL